jgi:cell division ATPase FtsA
MMEAMEENAGLIIEAVRNLLEITPPELIGDISANGIVLTGGGSSLRHLKELSQFTLQRSTRIGIPDIGFVNSIPAELKQPMYATSLGLLKHGIQVNEQEIEDDDPVGRRSASPKAESRKEKGEGKKGEGKKGGGKKTDPRPPKPPVTKNIWDSIKGFLDELTEKTS